MTAPTKMDPIAAEVAAGLTTAGIAFHPADDGGLRVPLPGGFGEFEIGALVDSSHGDSICGLVGENWHTHDDPLPLVLDVFDGRCLLIEERAPGMAPRKYVTYDFEEFMALLPKGATYKVYNATQEELAWRPRPSTQYADLNEFSDLVANSSDRVAAPISPSGTKRLAAILVLALVALLTLLAVFLSIR